MWKDRWSNQDFGQGEPVEGREKGAWAGEKLLVMQRVPIGRRVRLAILAAAFLTAGFVCGMMFYKQELTARARTQQHLAQEVLRFHVLANSDSEEDQALKLKVRDAVLSYLETEMPDAAVSENDMDVEQTKEWMRAHVDEIEKIGSGVVAKAGYDYPVNAAVTTCYFPDKTYGDVTFPAGNYEALRIEIGAAKGHNWWCVLYPGLCFMDATNAVVPDEGKEKLKNVLTEKEYSQVTVGTKFKIRWYFLDFLNDDEEE